MEGKRHVTAVGNELLRGISFSNVLSRRVKCRRGLRTWTKTPALKIASWQGRIWRRRRHADRADVAEFMARDFDAQKGSDPRPPGTPSARQPARHLILDTKAPRERATTKRLLNERSGNSSREADSRPDTRRRKPDPP